ncbi:MAG: aspartate ammonia-lyase [Clostridia bacterium]|nr:aspartate ammonia-lyase [Clostridia bacterium]
MSPIKERSGKAASRKNTRLIGSAGEYFVAGELSRNGITSALTMSGTDAFDILAIDSRNRQYAIQVKTTSGSKPEWKLSKKNQDIVDENTFYVLVQLNGKGSPDYYIVPAKTVAEQITIDHSNWLATPGKHDQDHNDNPMRVYRLEAEDPRYFNRWDHLGGA